MASITMGAAPAAAEAGERLHALDALRAGALLGGVLLHAALSFMAPRIWIVGDVSTSPAMNLTFYVLHIFRMTLFFLIAGFFARMLLERRGAIGFVTDRAKRIALPLVVFWLPVLAAIIAVAIWAAIAANGGVPPQDAPPPPPLTAQTFPLTHLWFLYVLLIFYAAALLLRAAASLVDRGGRIGLGLDWIVAQIVRYRLESALVGAPLIAALWFKPDWIMWFGVPTPDTGLVPNTAALAGFGAAFGFGWLLNRQVDLLKTWERSALLTSATALVGTVFLLWFAGTSPELAPAAQDWRKLVFAIAYVTTIWAWTTGLIGLAMRYLSARNPVIRYVADASYWIYIVHLPLVLALQAALAQLPIPWYGKYAAILAVAFPIMLITYHLFVRYTFVGAILNGRRHARRGKRAEASVALAAAE